MTEQAKTYSNRFRRVILLPKGRSYRSGKTKERWEK